MPRIDVDAGTREGAPAAALRLKTLFSIRRGSLEVQYALQHDEAQLIQGAKEAAEQLRELFEADSAGPLAGFSGVRTEGGESRS
jgi:hypothetical protein